MDQTLIVMQSPALKRRQLIQDIKENKCGATVDLHLGPQPQYSFERFRDEGVGCLLLLLIFKGAKLIASAMKTNTEVTSLDLRGNEVRNSVVALFSSLDQQCRCGIPGRHA